MNSKTPFFSIVLSTVDGSDTLKAALDSLVNQSYPKDKYEVIVVDDGSTDNTYDIAKSYDVNVYRHTKNMGLSTGRNTGLEHAKGDVYVCFDDDCIADKDWLTHIAKLYTKNNILGGGCLVKPAGNNSLVDIFFDGINYANPRAISKTQTKNPIIRFLRYILQMIEGSSISNDDPYEVSELSGATASFKVEYLREVGGWDIQLTGIEDLDICARLKNRYPEKAYYATNTTSIVHDHRLSVYKMAFMQYTRGIIKYNYYKRNNIVPPLFPFPFIYFGALLAVALITKNLISVAGISLLLPHLLYFWWPLRTVSNRNLKLLLMPYLHLLFELSTVLGLLTGMSKLPIYRKVIR